MLRSWCDGCRTSMLVAAIALSAMGGGCDQGGTTQAQPQQKGAASLPTVTVSKPLQREIVEWDEYTGRFEAVETVEIRARVSGYLTELHFKDGQAVKQGDLLFVLDARPFERTLEQAQAELLQAQTKVQNANLDVVRGKPLLERRIISEKTFDDRESLVREAQAGVKVAEAKVKTAELELSFTRITSPIDRPHQPHAGDGRQLGERGRDGQHDAAHHHRQPGPDLHLLRRQREQLHQVQAPGRARRELGRRRARRAGRGRAPRRARLSAQGAARLPRQPARSGHRHAARARRDGQQVGAVLAGPVRARARDRHGRLTRRRCFPTRPSAPTRPTSSSTWWPRTAAWRAATSSSARCTRACAWCAKASPPTSGSSPEGLQRARPGIKVAPKREALTCPRRRPQSRSAKAQE